MKLKKVNRIINFITNVLFYIAIIALVLYAVAGFNYVNYTNKNLDKIPVGSIVVCRGTKQYKLNVDDVVLVKDKNMMYQVKSLTSEQATLVNNHETRIVLNKNIHGIYIFNIPYLGYVYSFLITKLGIIITIGLIIITLVLRKVAPRRK